VKRFLKLTGGSYAGRRIYVPDIGVRPATNLVREAIFSTLNSFFEHGVQGCSVLDLFAGTGSLGLEALSRGSRRVTFVDSRKESIRAIIRNLQMLGFTADVERSDVNRFLKKNNQLEYELIFMDPPYKYKNSREVVELIKSALKQRNSAVLVYERSFDRDPPDFGDDVEVLKRKKYGQTELIYFRI
jgi:16S rRNA (guanine966-N2)-methyltransferase